VFDVLAYQWDDFVRDPVLILQIWKGISSYGGFLGGSAGWFFYVWWKKLPQRLFADTAIIGLLVAFSIGRIACTVVSDHVGAAVDPSKWYAALAMEYPRHLNVGGLSAQYPGTSQHILAWNLGLIEFLYLIPVNLFILWYAFRPSKRPNAGMITVLITVLYAPVRFFLDFLRLNESDPRYFGLTFAQWASILAFGGAIALAMKIARGGKPAEVVAPTSGEAQRRLKTILKEDPREKDPDAVKKLDKDKKVAEAGKKDPKLAKTLPEDDEDAELAKEALAADPAEAEDAGEQAEPEAAADQTSTAKPAGKPRPGGGGKKKNRKR
jgi:phosphatidylglycerol---prolipoprotein diacylglyceryl transferase